MASHYTRAEEPDQNFFDQFETIDHEVTPRQSNINGNHSVHYVAERLRASKTMRPIERISIDKEKNVRLPLIRSRKTGPIDFEDLKRELSQSDMIEISPMKERKKKSILSKSIVVGHNFGPTTTRNKQV